MSTFQDLATDALQSIGQAGQGQSISPEMAAQALRVANRMLQTWSTQRLFIYTITNTQYALSSGVQDFTLGPSATGTGSFVGNRPVLVESAQCIVGGLTLPVSILDKDQWNAIRDKSMTSTTATIQSVYIEYTYPNLAFHVFPISFLPSTIQFGTWQVLQQFQTIFDTVTLPPGYEDAIVLNLAMALSPYYDMPLDQTVATLAANRLVNLQRVNAQSLGGALDASQSLISPNDNSPQPGQGMGQQPVSSGGPPPPPAQGQ